MVKRLVFLVIILNFALANSLYAGEPSSNNYCNGLGGFALGQKLKVSVPLDVLQKDYYWMGTPDFKGFKEFNQACFLKLTPLSHRVVRIILIGPKRPDIFNGEVDKQTPENAKLLENYYKRKAEKNYNAFADDKDLGYEIEFPNNVKLLLNRGYDGHLKWKGKMVENNYDNVLGWKNYYICCSSSQLDRIFWDECSQVKELEKEKENNRIQEKVKETDFSGLN